MAGNTEYKNNWAKEKLDRISMTVPKGYREELRRYAQKQNESLNGLIRRAIHEMSIQDQLFEKNKRELCMKAQKIGVPIENLEDWKQVIVALAVLEPKIPDIKDQYLSKCKPNCIKPCPLIGLGGHSSN